MRNGHSRSSKVVDFGTNRKRVIDYLLIINSNLGPILTRFRDIAGFLLKTEFHSYFTRIFGVFIGLDCRYWSSEQRRPKLVNCVITFKTNQTYMATVPQRHRQTSRQTDHLRQQYSKTATPPLLHPNFGAVPLGLDCRCWSSEEQRS